MKTRNQERERDQAIERQRLDTRIASAVIQVLGKPDDLHAIQVRRLWGDTYRVNVLTGTGLTGATIAHSYFLTADGSGNILESSPSIARRY
jgi:hypothetical protein